MPTMQLGAATQPGPAASRWSLTAPGLYLLGACVLGTLASSLVSGAYLAVLTSGVERVPLSGTLGEIFNWSLRIFGYGLGVGQLVALGLVRLAAPTVRSMGGAALGLCAAELAIGVAMELGWAFMTGGGSGAVAVLMSLSWIDLVLMICGEALAFETVLKLRREAGGGIPGPDWVLRAGVWVGWAPRLALWALSLLGMHRLLSPWPMFWVHAAISLAITVAWLAALRAAARAIEAAPSPREGGTAPAAATAGNEAGLRNLGLGVLWMLIGAGVTAFTYASASEGGGRYVVAYGAMAAGLVQAVLGLVQLLRRP